ncbi:MAG: ferredoxin family protein [Sedimentisphaerales bacterium]|nr:ferredoxin family protein [Sedimentisphaerales bacterium]
MVQKELTAHIKINSERCKGCGLCVWVCPQKSIAIDKISNNMGYFPACTDDVGCTGCAMCALICPEAAIEVYRDNTTQTDTASVTSTSGKDNA